MTSVWCVHTPPSTPPYICPFNLFMHLSLLQSTPQPSLCQPLSLQALLRPCCLSLPARPGRAGTGPRAPQPLPLLLGLAGGKHESRLWKFYIVTVFMGRVG